MARDRSLDEFLAGAGSASDATSGSGAGSDGGTGSADADPTSGASTEAGGPATPSVADGPDGSGSGLEPDLVYGWSIEERPCDDCGTAVSHRWYDGETVRCEDCKDWSPTRSETVADPSRTADDP